MKHWGSKSEGHEWALGVCGPETDECSVSSVSSIALLVRPSKWVARPVHRVCWYMRRCLGPYTALDESPELCTSWCTQGSGMGIRGDFAIHFHPRP